MVAFMTDDAADTKVRAPVGSVFALGWLMAELFDEDRQRSVTARQPSFNGSVQLPLVADLDPADRLAFLMVLLSDLLVPFTSLSDERVKAEAAKRRADSGGQFDEAAYKAELSTLHLAVLDALADEPEQLNAYQLGLVLSDTCWLPSKDGGPEAFISTFTRGHVAALQTWLNGAGSAIPAGSGAIVSKSLENWRDWIDVNAPRMRLAGTADWAQAENPMLDALRIQGMAWHSVLTADPDVSVQPAMGAWVLAASSVVRAAGKVSVVVLRRFWFVVVIAVAALAGLLWIVLANLSGASQAWASLITVATVLGGSGYGLGSGVARSFGGVGSELWNAARLDAEAWNVTWLPATRQSALNRLQLNSRGVDKPEFRKNLDA
jgi:hypothetical protein